MGDWLALEPLPGEPGRAILRDILPRRGTIVRARASDGRPQVLAANLDLAFLVSGLDHDLNPRRIERYLLLAVQAGVTPIVILNKVDIALDLPHAVSEVHAVAAGTRVVVSSALTGVGLEEIRSPPGAGPARSACWARRAWASPASPTRCSARSARLSARCGRTTAAVATRRRSASSSSCRVAACSSTPRACARSACWAMSAAWTPRSRTS